jgi:putative nucleotidyltransferase with HDIG domain
MKFYTDAELAAILDQPIFRLTGQVADEMGVECYVVGGYVRDIFLQRPSNDIDVVVVGSGIEVATRLKKLLGRKAHLSVFKNFGTAQVKILPQKERSSSPVNEGAAAAPSSPIPAKERLDEGLEIEFVGARRESYSRNSRKPVVEDGTLEDDQNRRDFTINAMAICLNSKRFGELVDPFNGLADLEDGIIATPLDPEVTFSDDPLRMMRCIRFATQLRFQIEDATFAALERMAERIKIVSMERITVELNKIMLSPTPSRGLVDLQRAGLLQFILPEVAALDVVEQHNGRAHKNNFYHTLEVLENVCRTENSELRTERYLTENGERRTERYDYHIPTENGERRTERYDYHAPAENGERRTERHDNCQGCKPTDSKTNHTSQFSVPSSQQNLYLRWAALLHDIGKTKTKRWDPAIGWTFHNHNYIGMKMVEPLFRRLKLPMGAEMHYVEKLVELHMRPQAIADDIVTDSAVRRLLSDAGDDIDDLMTLCEADITSKNEVKKKIFLENFRMVREKLADLKEKDYKRLLQPVIDGNEIMQLFSLKPSREVGILKQYLKDAVLDNRVENEHEPLMKLLKEKARAMGLLKA